MGVSLGSLIVPRPRVPSLIVKPYTTTTQYTQYMAWDIGQLSLDFKNK